MAIFLYSGCLIAVFLYFILKQVRSPLRSLPGPALARFSRLWLFRREVAGHVTEDLLELHKQHGPVIRIAPDEVSILDPEVYFDVIYCQGSKFRKAHDFYLSFENGAPNVFTSFDPAIHSSLRRLMSSAFSEKAVWNHENAVRLKLGKLCAILTESARTNKAINLSSASRSLTMDIVTEFMYGDSIGALDDPELEYSLLPAMDKLALMPIIFANMPGAFKWVFLRTVSMLPTKIAEAVNVLNKSVNNSLDKMDEIIKSEEAGQTVFLQMKRQGEINQVPVDRKLLFSEGSANIFAGTDTTAAVLTLALWSIFKNPEIYQKLHQELRGLMPEKWMSPDPQALKALPYLTACIKEGLRLAAPIRGRLPREVPASGWKYRSQYFPPGTIVSSSALFMHRDPAMFPNGEVFDPQRWLTLDKDVLLRREKMLVPFSKGSRGCLGQNLAWMELRICLSGLVRRFRATKVLDHTYEYLDYFSLVFTKPLRVEVAEVDM